MIAFTAAEIAEITNGRLDADPGITPLSVVTDSREATPGSLYVAKPGEHADGHDFVATAFGNGSTLALVERPVAGPDGARYPAVLVADAVLAMGALAAEAVRRIRSARQAAGEEFTVAASPVLPARPPPRTCSPVSSQARETPSRRRAPITARSACR